MALPRSTVFRYFRLSPTLPSFPVARLAAARDRANEYWFAVIFVIGSPATSKT